MKLWHYIQGNRKGKEAQQIEKEAMKDPFLADALEGYEKTQGNHQKEITKLQKDITKRQKRISKRYTIKKTGHLKAWGIAACILIVSGLSAWFLLNNHQIKEDLYTVNQEPLTPSIPKVEKESEHIRQETQIPKDSPATPITKTEPSVAAMTRSIESLPPNPQPVAGMEAFTNYIQRNLQHPTDDECRNVKGTVTVLFKIGQSGRPYNIRVTQGLCKSINKEAIRLITNGPGWKKGTASDEASVNISFN